LKIKDLTTELFHAKQDILKAQIATQLELGENSTTLQNLQSNDEIDSSVLTPSPSSENSTNDRLDIWTLQRNAEFLRHGKG